MLLGLVALLAVVAVVAVGALDSGATLTGDPSALARLELDPFAGLVRAPLRDGAGQVVPLAIRDGRLTPRAPVTAGEPAGDAPCAGPVGSPGRSAARAPSTSRSSRPARDVVLALADGADRDAGPGRVRPAGQRGRLRRARPSRAPDAGRARAHGRAVAAGPGRVGRGRGRRAPVGAAQRAGRRSTGSRRRRLGGAAATSARRRARSSPPVQTIRLTLSRPSPRRSGRACRRSSRAFPAGGASPTTTRSSSRRPGSGSRLFTGVRVVLPHDVALVSSSGLAAPVSDIAWTTPAAATLRLQQLLAQLGYLPLDWRPAGARVPRDRRGRGRRRRRGRPRAASAGATRTRRRSSSGCGAPATRT